MYSDVSPQAAWPAAGHSMPRVNTPQGQTSKTHKAGSINYSEWGRLSETDKCALTILLLLFTAMYAGEKENRSSVVHYHALYPLKPTNPLQNNAI